MDNAPIPADATSNYVYQRCGGFSDLVWLFCCDNHNRGIIRQNFDEAALLWRAVQNSGGPILEIGRRHGGTTVLLVEASVDRPVTSIDLAPEHHPACAEYFRGVQNDGSKRLTLLIGDSRVAIPDASFGLLFIDGDHSYEGVRDDIIAHWGSLAAIDGKPALAVFHDAIPNPGLEHLGKENHCEGVLRACRELLAMGCVQIVESAGSSVVMEKLAELPEHPFGAAVHSKPGADD